VSVPHDFDVTARARVSSATTRTLRPDRRLFRQGVITVLALTMPVFAVLYWLTIPSERWPVVLAVQLAVILVSFFIVLGFLGAAIRVSPEGVSERGFFGRRHQAPIEAIGSILLVEIYRDSALDTQPQLFICSANGGLLFRMRGIFWTRADMDAVVDTIDVPIAVAESTVTMTELRRSHPELLYWFERFPGKTTAARS
jgi:hypothetical protein